MAEIYILFVLSFFNGNYGIVPTTTEFHSEQTCKDARTELNRKAGDQSDKIVSWCQPK